MGQTRLAWPTTRRQVLASTGATMATALAGCLGDGGAAPEPITLTEEDRCDVCGMVITNHPGPNAEIFYADQQPEGHDNPARFCSTWEAFTYDFERGDEGWTREAFYVTDYSSVDYDITTESGDRFISAHAAAESFAAGPHVTFDAGSSVLGSMGPDLIGFTADGDAEAFADEYGGEVLAFEAVDRSIVAELGAN